MRADIAGLEPLATAGSALDAAVSRAAVCLAPTRRAAQAAVLHGCPPVYTGAAPPPLVTHIHPPYAIWVPEAQPADVADALARLRKSDVIAMRRAAGQWRAAITGCRGDGAGMTWEHALMLEIANRMPRIAPRVSQWAAEIQQRASRGSRLDRRAASDALPLTDKYSDVSGAGDTEPAHHHARGLAEARGQDEDAASRRSEQPGPGKSGSRRVWQPLGMDAEEPDADDAGPGDDVCMPRLPRRGYTVPWEHWPSQSDAFLMDRWILTRSGSAVGASDWPARVHELHTAAPQHACLFAAGPRRGRRRAGVRGCSDVSIASCAGQARVRVPLQHREVCE
jgi:hypothetical protein